MHLAEVLTPALSDQQRHQWMEFIHFWLTGTYMMGSPNQKPSFDLLQKWRDFAALFPPQAPSQMALFRLVTVPIKFAHRKSINFSPAPGRVSSWTRNLVGLDAVAGVATDFGRSGDMTQTARIGIKAMIPGKLILATPRSIRTAFMTMSHDYFERYPEIITRTKNGSMSVDHPDYPGTNPRFTMDDVGFLQDVLNRPGGFNRQYEYIVQTPRRIEAEVVMQYRIGDNDKREGNDDPHGWTPPKVRRNVK